MISTNLKSRGTTALLPLLAVLKTAHKIVGSTVKKVPERMVGKQDCDLKAVGMIV